MCTVFSDVKDTNSLTLDVMSALKNTGIITGGDLRMAEDENKIWTARCLPAVRTRDGRILDSTTDTIVMDVCREMDRALLRCIKDAPFPSHVVNYQDINGLVSNTMMQAEAPVPLPRVPSQ